MRYNAMLLILFSFIGVFGIITKVESHGSGPPFLLIDGKYAQSNLSLVGTNQRFIAGMDFSPDPKYLANKPIMFEIDEDKMLLAEDQKKILQYRWQWDKDDLKYDTGVKQFHTYTSIGSHLVTLEAKQRDTETYTVIDSVKIDVVRSLDYVLPSGKIKVDRQITTTENILSFSADITKDNASKISSYTWKLDDEVYSHEIAPTHKYPRGSYAKQITLELVDSQGFYAYTHYSFTDSPETQETSVQNKEKAVWPYYLAAFALGVPGAMIAMLFIRKKKNLQTK